MTINSVNLSAQEGKTYMRIEYSGLYCTTQSGVKCTMIPEQSVQLFSVVFCI